MNGDISKLTQLYNEYTQKMLRKRDEDSEKEDKMKQ